MSYKGSGYNRKSTEPDSEKLYKNLDITITDETICIQRNFRDIHVMKLNKPMLALLDAIEEGQDEYVIHVHDSRKHRRYSSLSGSIIEGEYKS